MVIISKKDTATETIKAAAGPYRKPPMVITTSLGSYFRNRMIGIRTTHTMTYAKAVSIAKTVNFFVCWDLIDLPPKNKMPKEEISLRA
jgi:hypothetical protein